MIVVDPSVQMWITFAVIAAGMLLYAIDRIPMEITSLVIIVALLVVFQIFPLEQSAMGRGPLDVKRLLSGFADPALIAILSLMVMGQALVVSGALDEPVRRMLGPAASTPRAVLYGFLALTLVFSGIMNNTPIVAIFIPVINSLAAKMALNPSRVMIPLSYAAILGGNLTLIGSSTNLLVAGTYNDVTGEVLGFFDVTWPGLLLAVIGFAYVAFLAPKLLPDRANMAAEVAGSSKQFLVQLEVATGSPLDGAKAISGLFPELTHVSIRAVEREGDILLPPFHDIELRPGDLLLFAATRSALTDMLAKSPELLAGAWRRGGVGGDADGEGSGHAAALPGSESMLAEVMIAPASRLQGRTLEQVGFRSLTNCVVLGIQRRSRMIRSRTAQLVLEPGDVLLLLGRRQDVLNLRGNRDLLLLEWSASDFPVERNSTGAIAIFGTTVGLAAFGVLPITVAALGGALAMLLLGCLNIRQAARALDQKVIMIIAAAIAMGEAMGATGGAGFVADSLLSVLGDATPLVVLSSFFLMVALLTNVLSNNATAVLFTPIAVSIALEIGIDPHIFALATIFAAKCSFATPFGYQTNLMVIGPGHYRFVDFVKAGLPLTFIVWIAFTAIAAWVYDLG